MASGSEGFNQLAPISQHSDKRRVTSILAVPIMCHVSPHLEREILHRTARVYLRHRLTQFSRCSSAS